MQFLWRDRLYVVRAVLAHWVEAGAWWRRRGPDGLPMTIDAVEHEVWPVEADAGRSGVRGSTTLSIGSISAPATMRPVTGPSPGRWI